MPKCIECEHFYAAMTYCREYQQKITKYDIELPCSHFSPRPTTQQRDYCIWLINREDSSCRFPDVNPKEIAGLLKCICCLFGWQLEKFKQIERLLFEEVMLNSLGETVKRKEDK